MAEIDNLHIIINILNDNNIEYTYRELHTSACNDKKYSVNSDRQTRRYVWKLIEFGYDIKIMTSSNPHKVKMVKKPKDNPFTILQFKELQSLFLMKNLTSAFTFTPFYHNLLNIFQIIDSNLTDKQKKKIKELSSDFNFENPFPWVLNRNEEILSTIQKACKERLQLKIIYDSANTNTRQERIIGPHFLRFAQHTLYLLAEDIENKKNFTFSILRIKKVESLNKKFTSQRIDANKYYKHSFGIIKGKGPAQKIIIKVSNAISPYIGERTWHPTQKIRKNDDGSILIEFKLNLTNELDQWILRFGADLEVLEPPELKARITQKILNMSQRYNNT